MALAKFIKEARIKRGLSQRDLAKISGVGNAMISKIERGATGKPSYETMSALATALRVPLNDITKAIKGTAIKEPEATPIQDTMKELMTALPVPIPIYTATGDTNKVIGHLYLDRKTATKNNSFNYVCYVATKDYGDASSGDLIILDTTADITDGCRLIAYDKHKDSNCIHIYKQGENLGHFRIFGVIKWIVKRFDNVEL